MNKSTPLKGRCGVCNHSWNVAYLPLQVRVLAAMMTAAKCPKGCNGKVYCA